MSLVGSELSFVGGPKTCLSWVLSDRAAPGWRAPLRVIPGRKSTGPPFYLRGTRQPDTALIELLRALGFKANAGGNGAGDQGRWVTGSRK